MTDSLSLPQSGEEALKQLLARGLSQDSPDDPNSYCKLLQVLFEHCILKPITDSTFPSPTITEQVRLTLTILQRQTTARPELLSCSTTSTDSGMPLYKWILPRLIYAAYKYEDAVYKDENAEGGMDLADDILQSASEVITVLCRDLDNENGTSYAKGNMKAALALRQLKLFCEGVAGQKPIDLFGFSKLPADNLSLLLALQVIFRTHIFFTDDTTSDASAILATAAQTMKSATPKRQTRFARTLTYALRSDTYAPILRKACIVVSKWPAITTYPPWQNAMYQLNQAMLEGDIQLRADVWWTLYDDVDKHNITTLVGGSRVQLLSTPIPGHISVQHIREILFQRAVWETIIEGDNSPMARTLDKCFRVIRGEPESSRKRKRDPEKVDEVLRMLKKDFPDMKLAGSKDIIPGLTALVKRNASSNGSHSNASHSNATQRPAILSVFPRILPAIVDEDGAIGEYLPGALYLWKALFDQHGDELAVLQLAVTLFDKADAMELAVQLQTQERKAIVVCLWETFQADDRRKRITTGRAIALIFRAQASHPTPRIAANNRKAMIAKINQTQSAPSRIQESAILLLGEYGRLAREEDLGDILEPLVVRLGSPSAPLRSAAYTQIMDLSRLRNKTPYNLISPHMERIATLLAKNIVKHPDIVVETMSLIGYTRKSFFAMTLRYTIPALVMAADRQALESISSIVGTALGFLLFDHAGVILSKIFLCDRVEGSFEFLIKTLHELTHAVVTHDSVMTSCAVPFIVSMVVELGDEDVKVVENAVRALHRAQKEFNRDHNSAEMDLGPFLKPHMLGIISQLNERLHDLQGKKSVEEKRKIIRSISQLIRRFGPSMVSFSPQIIASLQSTLGIPELRGETLLAWYVFVETLKYADIGPFVGRTTGAIAANWSILTPTERETAVSIIRKIADNAHHLAAFRDEFVGLDAIPELRSASKRMMDYRKDWTVTESITNLLGRTTSKNTAVATASMRELRDVLCNQQKDIIQLSRGDMFDPLVSKISRTLLANATRDGDCSEIKDLSYECIGIVGALDPDRILPIAGGVTVSLHSNFADHDESIDFALHLIRDLLVDAFRATNDTKHQSYLAYAIQQLLTFCDFTPKVLQPDRNMPARTRAKWATIPKDQHETLAPLLESRFQLHDISNKPVERPVYPNTATYREWLQKWTTDLVGQIMSLKNTDRGTQDCKTIFGVFRGVLKSQDVAVAHHILPYLVLTLLLIGSSEQRLEICAEINTVLLDQVNSSSPATADKRMLSSQVIFDLMDHLSKWLRQNRVAKTGTTDRTNHVKAVENVLSSIESELMANAALQSKAYARSLRSFEQRLYQLKRVQKRQDQDLQEYYERIHQIYAELDEPDGMEGISTFVIAPSLEHQIREHESTGRWTSAQSCWEVRLQQDPDDVSLHVGLLKCLRNLGHYDTLRTHIRGVLSRSPAWSSELAAFESEAAWIIGDWATVESVGDRGPPIAQVLLAVQKRQDIEPIVRAARRDMGRAINSHSFARAYDPILQLHLLREIQMIYTADKTITSIRDPVNRTAIIEQHTRQLTSSLSDRFDTAAPAFRVREAILSMRRTAFSLATSPLLKPDIGIAWITSSKIARKAGYEQTAYSATLQAQQVDAPFTFLQQAKLSRMNGGAYKALTELENAVKPLVQRQVEMVRANDRHVRDPNLAKAVLVEARWANETDRFENNEIITRYQNAISLAAESESPYYRLGHYYDTLSTVPELMAAYHTHTVYNYLCALRFGVKYIFRTMPRLLTIWLDLGENYTLQKAFPDVVNYVKRITNNINDARRSLPVYQWLTAFPQLVSRILHPEPSVNQVLYKIIAAVIMKYPHQALWPMVGVMQSNRPERVKICSQVIHRASAAPGLASMIRDAQVFSRTLLKLADDKVEDRRKDMSITQHYPYVHQVFPSKMIMPLQDALTCSLPSTTDTLKTHNPFPGSLVEIRGIEDRVDVMPSLQRPKKLVFQGSDGKRYPFLCKPHDDLRKDARLMDFNAMINKLLKSASESRRRQLYIRTYAVMPLNEECGLLEWVANTHALKNILEKGYQRQGKRIWPVDLPKALETAKRQGAHAQIKHFKDYVLPIFAPTVFYDWFLLTWPEPSAWLASRLAYSRTLAVMSMVGYVLGLGDRHGENILFDSLTGDTVHVDLNCLFDKGKTFEIPERVPFRLTHNMVEAMGVNGTEGVFRKAAEISLQILRTNSESLMTVLEAFVHDPLVEWTKKRKNATDVKAQGEKNLGPIKKKLNGQIQEKGIDKIMTVPNQVDWLIKQATSPNNLGLMYQGWASWL